MGCRGGWGGSDQGWVGEGRPEEGTVDFDRCCAEIEGQAGLLAGAVEGTDLGTPVPSCPGWNVAQLLRHLGGGLRWAEETVRTRATGPLPDDHFRQVAADPDPALGGWVAAGAGQLAATLRATGPDAALWSPVVGGSSFYASRFAYETLIHRADAALALGAEFVVAPEVAADALDEWMELGSLPEMLDFHPGQRELLGPGRTIHLRATDAADAEWIVDLTGPAISWRRAHEKAAVAVRGPLTELLLLVYGRRPVTDRVEVLGDRGLLDFWRARTGFG